MRNPITLRSGKKSLAILAKYISEYMSYKKRNKLEMICYSDADHGGDRDDRKSISAVLVLTNGAPVVWRSRKQSKIANSTAVAEFLAASTPQRKCCGYEIRCTKLESSRQSQQG